MIRNYKILIPFLILLLIVLGCSLFSGKTDETLMASTEVGTPVGDRITKNIGPDGGTLTTHDGKLTLTVPKNAVTETTPFSIQPITNKIDNGIGNGYRLEPSGKTFAAPLELSIHFDEKDLEGTVPEALSIAYQDKVGGWHDQRAAKLDQAARSLTITTTHFTDFSFLARMRLSPAEATVRAGKMLRIEMIECSEPSRWDKIMGRPAVCGSAWHPADANWKLRGAGKIIPNGYVAVYQAPDAKPDPNVVWVDATVVLEKLDPDTGITMKAEKTFSAKITIAGKGYRVSGTAGETVLSGVICDLDQPFTIKSNNPFLEAVEFTPDSPSFGKWEVATKNGVIGGGDGRYVLQGPADNRTGIFLNGFSTGSSHGITLSGGGSFQLTLTPLSLVPTIPDKECGQ